MKKFWKDVQHSLLKTVAPWAAAIYLYLVGKTSKTVVIGQEAYDTLKVRSPHLIYVAWHEQILLHTWFWRHQGITILISQSRDGEYVNRLLELLGFRSARGSSSRGGVRGLLQLVRTLKDVGSVGIIADGPRGPARACKPGAILLAKQSGIPIVPTAAAISRYKRVKSWDRLVVPLPFATFTLAYGEPIVIPDKLEKDVLGEYQRQIDQALNTLTATVEETV